MPDANIQRETWVVTNNTSRNIIIGDIKNAPVLKPNRSYNLLKFSTKEEINQSTKLIDLVAGGWVTLNKITDFENKEVETDEASQAVTSVEVDELLNTVTAGEEITDDTEGILLFGEDQDGTAQAVGIAGADNNEIQIKNLDLETLLEEIYIELIKANMQMSIITGNEIKNRDISIPTE